MYLSSVVDTVMCWSESPSGMKDSQLSEYCQTSSTIRYHQGLPWLKTAALERVTMCSQVATSNDCSIWGIKLQSFCPSLGWFYRVTKFLELLRESAKTPVGIVSLLVFCLSLHSQSLFSSPGINHSLITLFLIY